MVQPGAEQTEGEGQAAGSQQQEGDVFALGDQMDIDRKTIVAAATESTKTISPQEPLL